MRNAPSGFCLVPLPRVRSPGTSLIVLKAERDVQGHRAGPMPRASIHLLRKQATTCTPRMPWFCGSLATLRVSRLQSAQQTPLLLGCGVPTQRMAAGEGPPPPAASLHHGLDLPPP